MRRQGKLYDKLVSEDNLRQALLEVNLTHRWYPRHRPNPTVVWVEQDVDARVRALREIIDGMIAGAIRLRPPRKKRRWDKSAGKWRDINEPNLWPDQYVHHALVQVLQPVMMRGMDAHCCGSIRGRGIHYGMKCIKKWMKNDRAGTKSGIFMTASSRASCWTGCAGWSRTSACFGWWRRWCGTAC